MVISCVHSVWKLKLKLSVHLYWSPELSRYKTFLTKEAFSSIPQNSAIIEEAELLSLLPSPLCSNLLTHCAFHACLLFCPINPSLMSSMAALFHYTLIHLFSPLCGSKSLSPGPAHPVNALPCPSLLGLLRPPLPAGLPSELFPSVESSLLNQSMK